MHGVNGSFFTQPEEGVAWIEVVLGEEPLLAEVDLSQFCWMSRIMPCLQLNPGNLELPVGRD